MRRNAASGIAREAEALARRLVNSAADENGAGGAAASEDTAGIVLADYSLSPYGLLDITDLDTGGADLTEGFILS